eukprot:6185627-Pleurochrysis_carterae.AAC.1
MTLVHQGGTAANIVKLIRSARGGAAEGAGGDGSDVRAGILPSFEQERYVGRDASHRTWRRGRGKSFAERQAPIRKD